MFCKRHPIYIQLPWRIRNLPTLKTFPWSSSLLPRCSHDVLNAALRLRLSVSPLRSRRCFFSFAVPCALVCTPFSPASFVSALNVACSSRCASCERGGKRIRVERPCFPGVSSKRAPGFHLLLLSRMLARKWGRHQRRQQQQQRRQRGQTKMGEKKKSRRASAVIRSVPSSFQPCSACVCVCVCAREIWNPIFQPRWIWLGINPLDIGRPNVKLQLPALGDSFWILSGTWMPVMALEYNSDCSNTFRHPVLLKLSCHSEHILITIYLNVALSHAGFHQAPSQCKCFIFRMEALKSWCAILWSYWWISSGIGLH